MRWFFFFLVTLSLHANIQIEREEFQKYGYVWLKNFYSPEQVALLKQWAEEINSSAETLLSLSNNTELSLKSLAQTLPGSPIVVPEAANPLQVCRAEDLLSCFPHLGSFINGTVTSYLSYFLEEPYVPFKDKLNFKWPGGGAFAPHQDFPAFAFLGPREHITAMVCIDAATLENGCLYVAKDWKDSFRGDLDVDQALLQEGKAILPYIKGGANHGSIEPEVCEKIEWTALETSPGDVVFFTSYVPHYSEPNQSPGPRRALFFTYNRLFDGEHKTAYYHMKREDPDNPMFHFATPTHARTK